MFFFFANCTAVVPEKLEFELHAGELLKLITEVFILR
jgi:hypothetical protein